MIGLPATGSARALAKSAFGYPRDDGIAIAQALAPILRDLAGADADSRAGRTLNLVERLLALLNERLEILDDRL